MPEPTPRPARARALAGLYAALGAASSACAHTGFRPGERAVKPLLMPVLAAYTLAAGEGRRELRLPAAGMAFSGLGDTALLGSESWFVPGMGCFAAAHACYIAALARDGAARGVRPRVAAGYAALWAVLIAVLWRRLGSLRVPVAAYSLLLFSMAVLASGRSREAAAGGALFVLSDTLIACGLAGVTAVPRQESAVMPTYVAAQFLLAAGWLRPREDARQPALASLRPWTRARRGSTVLVNRRRPLEAGHDHDRPRDGAQRGRGRQRRRGPRPRRGS